MSPSKIVSKSSFQNVTLAMADSLGMTVLAKVEFDGVIAEGARTMPVGAGTILVSSDSDMTMLPLLQID